MIDNFSFTHDVELTLFCWNWRIAQFATIDNKSDFPQHFWGFSKSSYQLNVKLITVYCKIIIFGCKVSLDKKI
jgi:hypothetical protein